MFDNLMQNLFLNAKNKIEEEKKLLEDKIIDININEELLKEDKEMIEDLLVININKALEQAVMLKEKELETAKNDLMPDINDIFNSLNDSE